MTSETPLAQVSSTAPRPVVPEPARSFELRLTSTARSARMARRIAVRHLAAWGVPGDSDSAQAIALVVSELCANAVTHGRVPGRQFLLRVTLVPGTAVARVEVSDASAALPRRPDGAQPSSEDDSGRGLLLVQALASSWGVASRDPVGKTVWAECPLTG